ncbi:MAG: SDR family oxidoreductase [Chloroflexota bacterium]|mgnify:CR=1 FL=1|jgi:NAD(P)-dependent dehydrogenase (short-subunit alcohol dehydrogenase family)|nr:SDR family oxidoreductase [Chloroflexota bacterium]MDP6756777.1 SDR family oxidoreductase [Chloroflexota bacterium]
MRLAGKVAIVTGAASGIGRAGSLVFAREGARVAVTDINDSAGEGVAEEIRQAGGDAHYWHCDVSNSDDVQATIQGVGEHFGQINILYNNAAYLSEFNSVTETTEDSWNRAIGTTLGGVYLCCKYAIPHLIEAGGGSIVSTASVGGLVVFRSNSAYCTAKAGVIMLMKSIAADYGEQGVRANAIAPGAIDSIVNSQYPADSDVARLWSEKSLVGRPLGDPDEIAAAAVFLASDESSFVTGTVLPVDGGWTAT